MSPGDRNSRTLNLQARDQRPGTINLFRRRAETTNYFENGRCACHRDYIAPDGLILLPEGGMLLIKLLFTDLLGKRIGHRVMRALLLVVVAGLKI